MLKKTQVDAIFYVHASDVFIAPIITKSFVDLLRKRAIENVIFLTLYREGADLSYDFVLTRLPTEGIGLLTPGQDAWRMQGKIWMCCMSICGLRCVHRACVLKTF